MTKEEKDSQSRGQWGRNWPTCQTPEFSGGYSMEYFTTCLAPNFHAAIFPLSVHTFALQSYYWASLLQEGFACNLICCQFEHEKTKSSMESMKHVKGGGLVVLMLAVIWYYWSQMSVEMAFFKPLHALLVSAIGLAVTNSSKIASSRKISPIWWISHLFNFSLYHILNNILRESVRLCN